MKTGGIMAIIYLLVFSLSAKAQEEIILDQIAAPIRIISYNASYKRPDRVGDGVISHTFELEGSLDQAVEAFGIRIRVFDSFKRSMDRVFTGYDMDSIYPNSTRKISWNQRAKSAYLFRRHGIAIAYIAIARFEDGTIWKADEATVNAEISKIELELELSFDESNF